jgi:putative aldouronate transport system substrate-binding protein
MTKTTIRLSVIVLIIAISAIVLFLAFKASVAPQADSLSKTAYPIKAKGTLTYFSKFHVTASKYGITLADIPLYKEVEKRTGVKVKFIHPPLGQEREQLNLIIASGDLPDVMEYNWLHFPGGPEKAIQSGIITPLNPLMNKNAPNLKKLLRDNGEVDKMIKTDSGKYYGFPFLRMDDSLLVYMGLIIRNDWLQELGLSVPTTIDEWHTVLKAFKEKKNAEAPLVIPATSNYPIWFVRSTGAFVGAYGIKCDFYLENGKVRYGPIEPGFKKFLATMGQWYREGLLDRDLGVTDRKGAGAKVLSGKSGAAIGYAGGDMGGWLDAMKTRDPKFDVAGVPYPTLTKGEKPKFGHRDPVFPGTCAVISAKSKKKDLAAQYLDFNYSPEGQMLFNFGIEGVSYRMENGYPKYTELLTNNPKGFSLAEAMGGYIRANDIGPFVQDKREYEQYLKYQQQVMAIDRWKDTDEAKYMMPPVTATPEESSELASIMNAITTYREEMIFKFILGLEPIDKFDTYVAQIKKLGIDRAIAINQAALARYHKR